MKVTGSNVLQAMLGCAVANAFTAWQTYGLTSGMWFVALDQTVNQYIGFLTLWFMWMMDNYRLKVEAKS